MSEVNIDVQLVRDGGGLVRGEERLVEMSNGCICCTLREDLLVEVRKLAEMGRFEYLLIESTGISEPMPVAETFTFLDPDGRALSDVARLDTMVTVVDASSFLKEYDQADYLSDRQMALNEDDDRTVVDLLVDQVEFADVILINKTDQISSAENARLHAVVQRLNPDAKLIDTQFGKVSLDEVLGTNRFSLERANQAAGWLKTLRGEEVSESKEYGISSFVFRARRPFHPQRFWDVLHSEWPGLLRSKGFFWLASRNDIVGIWSQAGGACRFSPGGFWWAANPPAEWPQDDESQASIREFWADPWGDRRQELVFIGIEHDEAKLRLALERALLTDEELAMGPRRWPTLDDPFPEWSVEAASPDEQLAAS
jgi:G3E family GTPase